jgi:UDP:flavonoid glycosyltransferase YjiC (YdhE family)
VRALFTPLALRPHLYPLIPLAWAFRAAGHDVRVAAQPPIVADTVAAGLNAVRAGADYDYLAGTLEFLRSADFPGRDRSAEVLREQVKRAQNGAEPAPAPTTDDVRRVRDAVFAPWVETARAMARDLIPFAREWQPDLVVTDPMSFVGPLVAETTGVPLVRHLWGPDMPRASHFPLQNPDDDDVREQWPTGLVELFDQWQVPPHGDYAACVVDPCPASMQVAGVPNRLPVRYVPYNGSGQVPAWLNQTGGRTRICVTWGTTAHVLAGTEGFLVPTILAAVAEFDVDVVVAVTSVDRDQLGPVPEGVRVVTDMPLSLLLPTCAAVVNQGGAGTILTAAACGVPQVIIPQVADQPFNAEMLVATGAGTALTNGSTGTATTTAAITDAVRRALGDPAVRTAAADLRAEIQAQPAPSEIIENLTRLPGR